MRGKVQEKGGVNHGTQSKASQRTGKALFEGLRLDKVSRYAAFEHGKVPSLKAISPKEIVDMADHWPYEYAVEPFKGSRIYMLHTLFAKLASQVNTPSYWPFFTVFLANVFFVIRRGSK